MHASAYDDARRFVERYLEGRSALRIADVGSFDVNGSLRPLLERPTWSYVGLDAVAGPNVDHVLSSDYDWPEIPDGSFDVVVSTQTVEHVPQPWKWIREVARICKPGGLIYVCSPNTWGFHEYPVDCWRVWPDGLRGLFDEAHLETVDAYSEGPDTTAIGRKRSHDDRARQTDQRRLTVLATTTGRPTLARMLKSVHRQAYQPGDEVLLVHDGPVPDEVRQLWREASLPGRLIALNDGPYRDWGHTPRNQVLPQITEGYVVHLDDDDVLAPHALDAVRTAIRERPGAFFLFRITYPDGRLIWTERVIREGNVGTAPFVHPAGIRLGRFGAHHNGDFQFVDETIRLHPERAIDWRSEATHLIEPHQRWVNPRFQDLRLNNRSEGRSDSQSGWHTFFGRWFRGKEILDVGAGLAPSKSRLALGGNVVTTQDVATGLPVDRTCDLSEIADESYDVVTAFDVLEHVPDDQAFLFQLLRIARQAVVLTTPNVWVWHCGNPFHIREYSPPALLELVADACCSGPVSLFASAHHDGSHPTPLPPVRFLGCQHPVLGVVLWKQPVAATSRQSGPERQEHCLVLR